MPRIGFNFVLNRCICKCSWLESRLDCIFWWLANCHTNTGRTTTVHADACRWFFFRHHGSTLVLFVFAFRANFRRTARISHWIPTGKNKLGAIPPTVGRFGMDHGMCVSMACRTCLFRILEHIVGTIIRNSKPEWWSNIIHLCTQFFDLQWTSMNWFIWI